jgi:hypothetical protein
MAYQRESVEDALQRWEDLSALQDHYADFADFLHDVQLDLFGWETTPIQYDIGNFLHHGGRNIMIQAQRGQAKTTITAIYAVWCLIHDPKHRVIIISAAGDKANEISKGIINIINGLPMLECMQPDRNAGDRTSTEAFDLHYTLRGDNMNPSVKCMGITSNLQGKRADLLIPDDVESQKNATTQTQREILRNLTLDFTSICTDGRIVYLGTPQTSESIYNDLPGRGYTVRIWPGRFPTEEEELEYNGFLAPWIVQQMKLNPSLRTGGGILGDVGKPTDTSVRLDEASLQFKETDQGPAYFKLQHMLCTRLSDESRFPLKLRNLVFMHMDLTEGPGKINWQPSNETRIPNVPGSSLNAELHRYASCSEERFKYAGKMMYVDTAGGGKNGDETVAVVTYFLHGNIFVADILGQPGGFDASVWDNLSALAYKHQVNYIHVEKNFGNGAFAHTWRPLLDAYYVDASGGTLHKGPEVEDVWESGQKEKRIIDILEPVIARHSLIINEALLEYDVTSVQKYPLTSRTTYMLFQQIAKITLDKDALIHDDRVDALAGAARFWVERLAQDSQRMINQAQMQNNVNFFANPFGRSNRNTAMQNTIHKYARRH